MNILHFSILFTFVCILSMLIMSPVYAQNDSTFKYDPTLQYGSKPQTPTETPEQLHKKLVNARDAISNIMGSKMGNIPFNEVGIDEVNSTLDVGIDSEKASLSEEQYLQKIKAIVGDIPIKITFSHITSLPLILSNNSVRGNGATVSIPSPLDQFKSGLSDNNIECKQGLQLVIKAEDDSPACVKPQTAQTLVDRGWGWAMRPMDSLKPSLPNRIAGLENDTGIVTFGNRTYYFETPHYTQDAYVNPVHISFHGVVFTLFPSGFKGGLPDNDCGSQYYWTDAKFSDGTSELLHIFPITSTSQQCLALPEPTYFSTHTDPLAGLTFYDGKMKLLVSTDNQTIEKKFSVIPLQVAKQSKTVNTTILQCENEFKPKESQHVTFPNGTSLTTNYVPVFLMKSNSTGKICITNNITSQSTDQSSIQAKTTSGVSKDDSETSDVIVVPYQENIVVDNTAKTIVYTITTSNDANGFYRISTTFDFCGSGIPLAVGYNSSHLFDNDFPWLGQTLPCPFNSFQSIQTQITGLTGIDVAYITKEYR